MKTRAFTLVELLGVIIILAVIFVLVFPSVTNIVSQSKETVYQKQINAILTATYDFTLKNISYLPDYNQKSYVTLGQLKYEGLIDVNIKNPETNEIFPDNLVVSINNVGTSYTNTTKNAILEGDYLYTVEIDKLNDESNKDLLPKIILETENSEDLIQNSDGNYIMTLDLNESFPIVDVFATSHTGTNLTDNVKKYIFTDEKTVESIDSSSPRIYKINYSVVDNNGYASLIVLNVIISDTISPTIKFPEKTTISKDITSFDLLFGVTCDDNSGFCDIEVSGEIEYGVVGSHNIIEYAVKDPSGNTTTKKRVIEIE